MDILEINFFHNCLELYEKINFKFAGEFGRDLELRWPQRERMIWIWCCKSKIFLQNIKYFVSQFGYIELTGF